MNEKQRQLLITSVILGLMCVLGTVYYYYGFAQDQQKKSRDAIEKSEKKKKELQVEIKNYTDFIALRPQIEEAVEAIRLATERLPTERNEQQYLLAMRDFIAKTGVDMASLIKVDKTNYTDWVEFPNQMTGTTRFMDFVQFLSLSEQNVDFFMRVKDFRISNDEKMAPTVHPFELTISSFVFKD